MHLRQRIGSPPTSLERARGQRDPRPSRFRPWIQHARHLATRVQIVALPLARERSSRTGEVIRARAQAAPRAVRSAENRPLRGPMRLLLVEAARPPYRDRARFGQALRRQPDRARPGGERRRAVGASEAARAPDWGNGEASGMPSNAWMYSWAAASPGGWVSCSKQSPRRPLRLAQPRGRAASVLLVLGRCPGSGEHFRPAPHGVEVAGARACEPRACLAVRARRGIARGRARPRPRLSLPLTHLGRGTTCKLKSGFAVRAT